MCQEPERKSNWAPPFIVVAVFSTFPWHTWESMPHLLIAPLSEKLINCVPTVVWANGCVKIFLFSCLLGALDFPKSNLIQSPTCCWSSARVPERRCDSAKLTQQWSAKSCSLFRSSSSPPYHFELFEAYFKTSCVSCPYCPYGGVWLQAKSNTPNFIIFATISSSVPKLLTLKRS